MSNRTNVRRLATEHFALAAFTCAIWGGCSPSPEGGGVHPAAAGGPAGTDSGPGSAGASGAAAASDHGGQGQVPAANLGGAASGTGGTPATVAGAESGGAGAESGGAGAESGGAGPGGAQSGGAASTGGGAGADGGQGGAATAGMAAMGASEPVTCPQGGTLTPGDSNRSVMVDGTARSYVLHVPTGYDGTTPVPAVIDFHPLGGNGAQWQGSTDWGAKADAEGFIMVWPSGVDSSWNVGRCCGTARSTAVDDVAFTRAIVLQLREEGCLDWKRVYATGCSNGGGMAYKVACEAADVIAAVAPVDFDCVVGEGDDDSCGGCTPERPISEIQFRGTNDTAVPYGGGAGPRREVTFPGAEANFSAWGEINQCSGAPEPLAENTSCQSYSSCDGDAQTVLCTVQGGSHCGSYGSFGIVDIAWEQLQKTALP